MYDPLIIVVLIMITCDLLLIRSNRISLDMRVEEATTVTHIFQRDLGTESDICKPWQYLVPYERSGFFGRTQRILVEIISDEIRLEKGAHLRVTWSRMIQNHEMELEGRHID